MLINDVSVKIDSLRSSIEEAIERVLDRGLFVLGPEVTAFEKNFAQYIRVPFCTTVANGTDALELALRAVGIKSGDCVATVANAGFYTSTAILALGASPFYLDINLETHLVSLSEIERAIHAGVKAIIVTHLYGRVIPEIQKITDSCQAADVVLIEDCAQAHGAMIDNKKVGSFGDIGCFSFYPTKNLGALGDGGALVCKNEDLAKKINQLRQYGWSSKYQVEIPGARNSRLDEIQAAVLNVFLPYLDEWNQRRRTIAQRYSKEIIHPDLIVPIISKKEEDVAHLYVIRSSQRASLRQYLEKQMIATDIHYPIPDYLQPIFGNQFSELYLTNTEKLVNEIVTLPCYPEMSERDVKHVINAVNHWPNNS